MESQRIPEAVGFFAQVGTALALAAHLAVLLVLLVRLIRAQRRARAATAPGRAARRAAPAAGDICALQHSAPPRADGVEPAPDGPRAPHADDPAAPLAPPMSELLECAGLLDGLFGERRGFELVLAQRNLRFSRRRLSARASEFLTEGVAECSAAEFLRLWTDSAFRREWDGGLLSLAPVEGGGGSLCHVVRYPYPLRSRHYIYDRHALHLPSGTTALLCASAVPRLSALGVPTDVPGSALCASFRSLTAVRPATDGSGRCEYAMLTLDEQPVRLPGWLLDSLLQRTYPEYMASVQRAVATLVARRSKDGGAGGGASTPVGSSEDSGSATGGSEADGECVPPPPVPARARAAAAAGKAPRHSFGRRAAAIVAWRAGELRCLGAGAATSPASA